MQGFANYGSRRIKAPEAYSRLVFASAGLRLSIRPRQSSGAVRAPYCLSENRACRISESGSAATAHHPSRHASQRLRDVFKSVRVAIDVTDADLIAAVKAAGEV